MLTFEHAASAAGKKLRFTVGDFDAEATTNAKGVATVEMPVEQSYGTHELKVSFAGDQGQGLRAAKARWMFEVLWEHTFADDDAPDQAVRINTIAKGLQFTAPGDVSEVKRRAASRAGGSSGSGRGCGGPTARKGGGCGGGSPRETDSGAGTGRLQ